jgi:hypothetical protein
MQKYISKIRNYLETYKTGNLIAELQTAPSKISNLEGISMAIGDCASCPECVCADFLGEEFVTAVSMVATTPVLLACKVQFVCP